jgi:hypothetical protein
MFGPFNFNLAAIIQENNSKGLNWNFCLNTNQVMNILTSGWRKKSLKEMSKDST